MELLEGELGRFATLKGEGMKEMYDHLKSLVNQVRNIGSKKWMDHEVVKHMLRLFISRNATLVSLVHGNARYKNMSPEEVLGEFLSHEMMVRDCKYIENFTQGNVSTNKPQVVAFNAINERKEETLSKVAQVKAGDLMMRRWRLSSRDYSKC
jgi:hypothetical protein